MFKANSKDIRTMPVAVGDSRHHKPPFCCEQDLSLRRMLAQTLRNILQ